MATLHQFATILNTVSSCAPFCFLVGICNLACICGKIWPATVKMVLYDYIYSFKYSPYVSAISFLLNYRWHHFQICARKNKYCIIWICEDCSTMFTQFMFSHVIWLRDQTWLCVYCWCQTPEGVVSLPLAIMRAQLEWSPRGETTPTSNVFLVNVINHIVKNISDLTV